MRIQSVNEMIVKNRLTQVGSRFRIDSSWAMVAVFLCECGKTKVIRTNDVMTGRASSCGCHKVASAGSASITHGHAGRRSPEYYSWCSMRDRCNSKQGTKHYRNYVERGISVCHEWKSFEVFLRDMGQRPAGTTLDRIDNSKGYSKDNCRWASHKQQHRNKRTNRFVKFNGDSITVAEAAERAGVEYGSMMYRIKSGLSVDQIIQLKEG